MRKTPDNKVNIDKALKLADYVSERLNRDEIGHLIDALYWKHKVLLCKTLAVIHEDLEKEEV